MTSYRPPSSNWFTLLLLCTNAPLALCCDRLDRGSRQVKREPIDLVTEDYDVSLCQRVSNINKQLEVVISQFHFFFNNPWLALVKYKSELHKIKSPAIGVHVIKTIHLLCILKQNKRVKFCTLQTSANTEGLQLLSVSVDKMCTLLVSSCVPAEAFSE